MTPLDRLVRVPRSNDRVIAGVAAGWAERWRVEPTVVRAALGLLTLIGGLGALLYGLAALVSAPPREADAVDHAPAPRYRRREAAIGFATAAILIVAREIGLWPGDAIMVPAAAVAIGASIAWSHTGTDANRRASQGVLRAVQVVAGIALLGAGVISLASRTGGLANVGASASAIAVVIGGLAMFAAPAVGRVLRTLDQERAMRIRDDERAAVAAHLHDSVLQSLVLIQRSDDPRHMAGLARRQERELRAWLYGTPAGAPTTVHAAIDALVLEIETDHDVRVEAVVVGDQPLDDAGASLVAALREAIVNAACHAAVDRVDVFVEADGAELRGFVHDTGRGFDPAGVPPDRRGIRDSIERRVQRAGGSTAVTSTPGVGTEIEICVPRARR